MQEMTNVYLKQYPQNQLTFYKEFLTAIGQTHTYLVAVNDPCYLSHTNKSMQRTLCSYMCY